MLNLFKKYRNGVAATTPKLFRLHQMCQILYYGESYSNLMTQI